MVVAILCKDCAIDTLYIWAIPCFSAGRAIVAGAEN